MFKDFNRYSDESTLSEVEHALPARSDAQSQVDSKLNLILKKRQNLEDKNQRLEERFLQQEAGVATSRVSHSSPKRSHTCTNVCGVKRPKKTSSQWEVQLLFSDNSHLEDLSVTLPGCANEQ